MLIKTLLMQFKGDGSYFMATAYDDHGLIGHACVSVDHTKLVQFIDRVYVKPDQRMKGVGHALLTELERYCISNKLGSVALQVNRKNDEVIAFYERIGYKLSFDYGHQILMTKYLTNG